MKDRMKVYHGIPKSVPDNNTIFYASFDGSSNIPTPNDWGYSNISTGYGLKATVSPSSYVNLPNLTNDVGTMEFWLDCANLDCSDTYGSYIVSIPDKVEADGGLKGIGLGYYKSAKSVLLLAKNGITSFPSYIPYSDLPRFSHFRLTWSGTKVSMYINGTLRHSLVLSGALNLDFSKFTVGTGIQNNSLGYRKMTNMVISDLHISNIDRGDYFPNLPQDFIEGKAIIKEKFGQQQIKGDPMCSQVTELKVPCWANSLGNYANNIVDSDNCYRYTPTPELSVRGSTNWEANTKIKVEGLNGEVISGVIDTDTALCRILKVVNSTTLIVDTVAGLSVGDSFLVRAINPSLDGNPVARTISSIDSATNTIVFSGGNFTQDLLNQGYCYVVETTTSSSSPVVKSQDGQTVVGTWSGLGTNSALFTLGTNTPSLEGKDLYVTYSLNMPPNNSHFPEIPYSVDKAYTETGVEMKPVTEIVIEDDFRGKISGSTKECPHSSYYFAGATLRAPLHSDFDKYLDYTRLYSLDGAGQPLSNNTNVGNISQQIFAFDVIKLVESKIGTIPSSDKVQWIKDNIKAYEWYVTGFSQANGSPKCNIKVFDCVSNTWMGDMSHSNSTHTTLKFAWTSVRNINSNGYTYLLLHSEPSTNTDQATIVNVDYVKLVLYVKNPSNYQALFCDNKRAREIPCNPVLVQKETKTVQRLIPSKESFVTESKSGVCKSIGNTLSHTIVHKSDFVYVTTQGTGSYNSVVEDYYRECIAKLTNDPAIKSSEFVNEELAKTFTDSVKFIKVNSFSYPGNSMGIHPSDLLPNITNKVFIKPYLINANGELKIRLFIRNGKGATIPNNIDRIYNLPNRPLIK